MTVLYVILAYFTIGVVIANGLFVWDTILRTQESNDYYTCIVPLWWLFLLFMMIESVRIGALRRP